MHGAAGSNYQHDDAGRSVLEGEGVEEAVHAGDSAHLCACVRGSGLVLYGGSTTRAQDVRGEPVDPSTGWYSKPGALTIPARISPPRNSALDR